LPLVTLATDVHVSADNVVVMFHDPCTFGSCLCSLLSPLLMIYISVQHSEGRRTRKVHVVPGPGTFMFSAVSSRLLMLRPVALQVKSRRECGLDRTGWNTFEPSRSPSNLYQHSPRQFLCSCRWALSTLLLDLFLTISPPSSLPARESACQVQCRCQGPERP